MGQWFLHPLEGCLHSTHWWTPKKDTHLGCCTPYIYDEQLLSVTVECRQNPTILILRLAQAAKTFITCNYDLRIISVLTACDLSSVRRWTLWLTTESTLCNSLLLCLVRLLVWQVQYQLVRPVLMACLSQRHWFFGSCHHSLAPVLHLVNLTIFVTIQQDTITQLLSDYFNVSKFCINLGNSAWNLVIWFLGKSLNLLPTDVRF